MSDALPHDFAELSLAPPLMQGVQALGYARMTPVQALSLPAILDDRDLIAQAPTGSGKTAAFGLGLLHRLDAAQGGTQALVLCPTRELADQVGKQLRKLAFAIPNLKLSILCGGMPLGPQLASLEHAPHVVVGTPGRIQELLAKRALDLSGLRTLVFDEADRMLDMGFEEPIRAIVKATPASRQGLLFSATFPEGVRAISRSMRRDPVEVTAEGGERHAAIEQRFYETDAERKTPLLAALLLQERPESCVVFCNMRRDVDEVAGSLAHYGFTALALHGDMEQRDRDEVLVRFANRSCNVLVASDVAARGLDVEDLAMVINYELPTDMETYQHRVGRTGRAGASGMAISLVAGREKSRAEALEAQRGKALDWQKAPLATSRPAELPQAAMRTLRIDGGKTDKLRPGDILGALTGDAGLAGKHIGKIAIYPTRSYVAIAREHANRAVAKLEEGKIKGRRFRTRVM